MLPRSRTRWPRRARDRGAEGSTLSGTLLGLDVGGTSVKAALVRGGEAVASASSDRYALPDTATLARAIEGVLEALGGDARGAERIGLAVPGILSADGMRVELAVNVPGLVGMDLAAVCARVAPGAGAPVVVPDAFASTYGHWALERRPGRLLGLVIGTGVGACVLDDGEALDLGDGSPGHLGQMDVGPCGGPAPVGPDGGLGSLEGYIGAASLRERLGRDTVAGLLAAPEDDPAFIALARAMRIAHAIYRPEEIVVLGGVGRRLAPRAGVIEGLARDRLTSVARAGWTLAWGGSDSLGAVGAALRAGV